MAANNETEKTLIMAKGWIIPPVAPPKNRSEEMVIVRPGENGISPVSRPIIYIGPSSDGSVTIVYQHQDFQPSTDDRPPLDGDKLPDKA